MLFMIFLSLLSLTALLPVHALPHHVSSAHELSRRGSPLQIAAFLHSHNIIRTSHNAQDLVWSPKLATMAGSWADNCVFERTGGTLSETAYGELHTAATGPFPPPTAIEQFTKDRDEYDPTHPTYNHWTQIVWQSTTHVGCARSQCNNLLGHSTGLATYYVCFYDPAGNVIGQAPKNVQV